eukprot:6192995-Pleurochrysis_carterae.AAC.1
MRAHNRPPENRARLTLRGGKRLIDHDTVSHGQRASAGARAGRVYRGGSGLGRITQWQPCASR